MTVLNIVRPEIRRLSPYQAASQVEDCVRLNANEASWNDDRFQDLNRYPEIRPTQLRDSMSAHYGVPSDSLLVTRGSSEAIDILTRTFCRAGTDNVVLSTPTFGMYRLYADLQGAAVTSVPTGIRDNFDIDVEQLLTAANRNSKLIFVCSPNNPTGRSVSRTDIERMATARMGQSVIVVDEAYIEFSDLESVCDMTADFDNLVVLRTTSKAMALAGIRCGCAIATSDVIQVLDSVLAPYSTPTTVSSQVAAAFVPERIAANEKLIQKTRALRAYLANELSQLPFVEAVIKSDANFLLTRFDDAKHVHNACLASGILLRDLSSVAGLENCLRISIGSEDEIELLLASLRTIGG